MEPRWTILSFYLAKYYTGFYSFDASYGLPVLPKFSAFLAPSSIT